MCSLRPGERAVHHGGGAHPAVHSRYCRRPHSALLLPLFLPLVEARSGLVHSPSYHCCFDIHLRFSLPPVSLPPWFLFDRANTEWSGFWIVMIDALASEMGFNFTIVPDIAFDYRKPLRMVELDEADIGFTDVADPAAFTSESNMDEAVCTPGLVDSTYGAMVLQTPKQASIFQLFRPIGPGVYFMTGLTLLLAAVVMTSINILVPPDSESRVSSLSAQEISKAFYHVLAALLNGEDYEWVTWPGRVLRLGMLFFALVLLSTYTANLAAFFTRPEFVIHGPQDLSELQTATVCALNPEYDSRVLPYVGSVVHAIPTAENLPGTYEIAKVKCHEMLKNREADAWIEDVNVLTSYLLGHCGDLHLVPSISILKQQPAFCLSNANSTLAWQLGAAIAYLKLQPAYQNIMREYFGVGRSCDEGGDDDEQDTVPVPLSGMWGLFVITGAFILMSCALALFFAMRARILAKKEGRRNTSPTPTSTEGEMLRLLLRKVDDLLSRTTSAV